MKKLKFLFRLFVFVLLIGGWSVAASALHIVWTGEKVKVLPKDRMGIRDTYVNISDWKADDVAAHPALAKRLVATGQTDVLAKAFGSLSHGEELEKQIDEVIARGPTTQPTPTVNDKVADQLESVTAKAEQVADKAKQAVDHVKGAVQ
ncbi:MAG: hypothetical protein QOE14_40 [Humisphaera sp.]|nr:hypothetical protein [Humisphaera sp.]